MNESDAQKQIHQMIEFIKQEAKEKAEEIQIKAEAEFNAKKLNQIAHARMELKDEFAKRQKDERAKKRIARSRTINNARFTQMRARDAILKELQDAVRVRLAQVPKNPLYKELVRALIVEGMLTLTEHHVEIQCRKEDVSIVKGEVKAAIRIFKSMVKEVAQGEPTISVEVNEQAFLPPGPKKGYEGVTCLGGVTVTARKGKIVCRNTLDARFEAVFLNLLPTVREVVFGKRD